MTQLLSDMDTFIDPVMDDIFDRSVIVVHISMDTLEAGGGNHVMQYFPLLPCPCEPEINLDEGVTFVIHHRTQ